MKKIVALIITVILMVTMLTGCITPRHEYFNNKDKSDFEYGVSAKFNIVQLKSVIDKTTLEKNNLDGGFFLFMGSVSGSSTKSTVLTNVYYGYLKNKNGAIYFAEIPATKVRIYEDSDTPCIVAYCSMGDLDNNTENVWSQYDMFNLHIPEGTIIPRVDLNFDINSLK